MEAIEDVKAIPEDVMKAAKSVADGWVANLKALYRPGAADQRYYLERHVEAAILAERDRCTKIADDMLEKLYGEPGTQAAVERSILRRIASSIRTETLGEKR